MSTVVKANTCDLIVDGASIRAISTLSSFSPASPSSKKYIVGVAYILPRVQIVLGDELQVFKEALNLSRLPIAIRKTLSQGAYETWEIMHLPAGKIPEANIATLSVYSNIIVGVTYSNSVLQNREFRRFVKLSAMHQITICNKDDKGRAFKATQCIEKLTGVPRDKLIVSETKRSIKVRVDYKSKLSLPIYYTFVLNKANKYGLAQIAFDLNDIGQRLGQHIGEN